MLKCKKCTKEYEKKSRNKCHDKGYCSYRCYRGTDEYKIMFKKTFIQNKSEADVGSMSLEEINSLFHRLKSKSVIESQPQRVKTIRSKGPDEFKKMGTLSKINYRKKFLMDNNIIQNESEIKNEEHLNNMFLLCFNEISGRGKKIHNGLKKKYGNKISDEFRRRYHKSLINAIVLMGIDPSSISKTEFDKLVKEICKKHAYHSPKEWKKTHIVNHCGFNREEVEKLNDKQIDMLYSQYLIDRKKTLPETLFNGYKRTKKGFCKLKHVNRELFFRSSWEERFILEIDKLIKDKKVLDIRVPAFIYYKLGELQRKYFPDFEVETKDGSFIFEIKPTNHLEKEINKAKIKAGKGVYNKKFIVITEESIFGDLKNDICKAIGV